MLFLCLFALHEGQAGTFYTNAFLSGTGAGPFEADTYDNCTIVPQSLGGSSYVGMPFDLYLSGDRTAGTATITPGTGGGLATATFTPADEE